MHDRLTERTTIDPNPDHAQQTYFTVSNAGNSLQPLSVIYERFLQETRYTSSPIKCENDPFHAEKTFGK
jgi:hypothetical protein